VVVLGAFLVVSFALFAVAFLSGWLQPNAIQTLVSGAGPWAMLGYVAAVVVAELLWVPRMWGLIAGGALFGPWAGGSLAILADLTSAAICYGLARGAGRPWVEARLARRPAARRVVDLFARSRGGVTTAVLRVCPVAHYTLVSYAAGLAGVSARGFFVGTFFGILPGAVLYTIVGDAALHPRSPAFVGSLAIVGVFLIATLIAGRRMLKG
jgi:uncharacterized membrane protein YdjX (TVP38/TMEM64 family)